jgi:hypothetical protein
LPKWVRVRECKLTRLGASIYRSWQRNIAAGANRQPYSLAEQRKRADRNAVHSLGAVRSGAITDDCRHVACRTRYWVRKWHTKIWRVALQPCATSATPALMATPHCTMRSMQAGCSGQESWPRDANSRRRVVKPFHSTPQLQRDPAAGISAGRKPRRSAARGTVRCGCPC